METFKEISDYGMYSLPIDGAHSVDLILEIVLIRYNTIIVLLIVALI